MGSNDAHRLVLDRQKPERRVYLDAFAIDKTEVTVAAYKTCVNARICSLPRATNCHADDVNYERENHPMNCVNWNQAKAYCKWAGKRLPTEAEWEKAARGTDGRKYPWGNDTPTCNLTVMSDCSHGTQPVGSKPSGASPYGALDMAGNVEEWTADWYDESYYANAPDKNPSGPQSGSERVTRGGGFSTYGSRGLTTSMSSGSEPSRSGPPTGFRCAR